MTTELAPLLREAAPAVWAYVDVSVSTGDPARSAASLRNDIRRRLEALRARDDDIDALDEALAENPGVGSPATRYLLVRDGRVEVDEVFTSVPLQAPLVGAGLVPDVVPLLRHRTEDRSYVLVEAGHDGGEVRLCRAQSPGADVIGTVDGPDDNLQRVSAGGWSELDYQRHTVEIWRRNQDELARMVDEVVREHHPDLVLVSGDVQAVTLLRDELGAESTALLSTVATQTAAAGASDDAFEERLAEMLREAHEADLAAVADKAGVDHGDLSARGIGEVVDALQQAAVDTIAIEPGRLANRTALALAAPPWIARTREEALGAEVIGAVPAQVAIARSALLTDAKLVFDDPERPLDDSGVVAALRWHPGPAVPGH